MRFSKPISAVAIGFSTVTSAISVSHDAGYVDESRALTAVACSDGDNGLVTKYGWTTQGAVPTYPYIGGYVGIAGWNSTLCGTCYSITYKENTIYVLAIDHSAIGFNIATSAMEVLTNNQAGKLGRIDAQYVQVANSNCNI